MINYPKRYVHLLESLWPLSNKAFLEVSVCNKIFWDGPQNHYSWRSVEVIAADQWQPDESALIFPDSYWKTGKPFIPLSRGSQGCVLSLNLTRSQANHWRVFPTLLVENLSLQNLPPICKRDFSSKFTSSAFRKPQECLLFGTVTVDACHDESSSLCCLLKMLE